MLPDWAPRLNHDTRWALEPCVKLSGTTVPCDLRCKVSSPVGLQFNPHRQRIHLRFRDLAAHAVDLARDAEQVLHVVADLVREHVSLREVTGRAHAALQRIEELQVDVDLAVARAVERPHRRLPGPAGRGRGAAKQHELGLAVSGAAGLEDLAPDDLGVAQHGGHERGHRVVRRRRLGGCLLR
jgi:hypothetical protein